MGGQLMNFATDEESILGLSMFDEKARRKMLASLSSNHFLSKDRMVFDLIKSAHEGDRPCEPASLNADHGKGDIAIHLCDLDCKRPLTLNPDHFVNRILEKHWKSEFITEANKVVADAESLGDFEIDQLAATHKSKPTASGLGLENPLLMELAVEDLEGRVVDHLEGRKSYLSTGWNGLDSAIGGFKFGTFTVLAGRPGAGKTSLALHFAMNCLKQSTPTIFLTWEMTEKELLRKMLSALSRVPVKKLNDGSINDLEVERYSRAVEQFKNYPLVVFQSLPDLDVVCAEIRRYHMRNHSRIAFIDYLGLIDTKTKHYSRREQMVEITRRMKQLAIELEIPIIGLAQLRRPQLAGKNLPPTKDDLKESGSLEEDADNVLLLWRRENDETKKFYNTLIVAKARHGEEGRIDYQADFGRNLFEEIT